MEQNPYESPKASEPAARHPTPLKDRPWYPALITVLVIVCVGTAIVVIDLWGFWLSVGRNPTVSPP